MKREHSALLAKILSRTAMTEAMLRLRLHRQGLCGDEADSLVRDAHDLGMVDDEAYARLFVEGHQSWGNRRIRDDLRRRGVSDTLLRRVLDERSPGEEEAAYLLCRELAETGLHEESIVPRLLRRGFSVSTAREAAERACSEIDRPVE